MPACAGCITFNEFFFDTVIILGLFINHAWDFCADTNKYDNDENLENSKLKIIHILSIVMDVYTNAILLI